MDPISNVSQLVETLRKQLIESQNRASVAAKAPDKPQTAAVRPGMDEIQRKVREKLRSIDANDPKAEQKSVRIFLETVLLWEFGDRLMDDPKFYALLDDVQHGMESDPAVRESLAALIVQLR